MGINPSKEFIEACNNWLTGPHKYTPAQMVDLANKEFNKPFDWNTGGTAQISSLPVDNPVPEKTIHMISDMASLAIGMNQYVKDIVKIPNPYFIHSQINAYYAVETKVMGEIQGSKNNTADCIITSVPPTKLFTMMKENKPQPDPKNQFVKVGGETYYQVSLKKSKSAAQLGKISGFIGKNLHVKVGSPKDVAGLLSQGNTYSDDLITLGIVSEGALWDKISSIASAVWDKAVNAIKGLTSSLIGKFKSIFSKGITKDDLDDMAKAVGYSGPITESMVSDFNYEMLNEVTKRSSVYDDKGNLLGGSGKPLDKSTQKLVEGIVNNPNAALSLVNKKLSEVEDVISTSHGQVVGHINRLNSISGKISDDLIPEMAFRITANYASVKMFAQLVKDSKDIGAVVRRLIAEMFFGGTKLPLWKVYGASKKGDKSYEYLGTIETFQKEMEGPTVELLGIGVSPSTNGKYYNMSSGMLESIEKGKKNIIIVRLGSNSSSGFTYNVEGSKVMTIPLNKKMTDLLSKNKD